MGPLAAVIAVTGGFIATLIYGQAYSGNGTLIALLILSLFVSSIAFSFSRGLFALERADIDFKVNLVAFALMLTVGIWLAYTFGVVGAAWGALLTNTVATVLRVRAFDALTTPDRE
jgi:O-antigen/teichoic acid export membrane protein